MTLADGRVLAIALILAMTAALTGCASTAPHALGLHDTSITESLPIKIYPRAWYGVPLNNSSDSSVTVRTLKFIGRHNATAGRPFVIAYPSGNYIDWYSPPGTPGMQRAISARIPLAGFTIPPHTKGRYQAVVLVSADDIHHTASVAGATVSYDSNSHRLEETWIEHASLRAAN
jgi:hypothetical protein